MMRTLIIKSVLATVHHEHAEPSERERDGEEGATYDLNPVRLRCNTIVRRTVRMPSAAMTIPSAVLIIHCDRRTEKS